jgi:malonyl CoA-acyl carrier protein transacylase
MMLSVIVVYIVMLICVITGSEIRVRRYKMRLRGMSDEYLREERKLKQKIDDLHRKLRKVKEQFGRVK